MEKRTNKDYSNYSFEDFLLDDFFVSSMVNPNEESRAFWRQFEIENPNNITEFNVAKHCVLSVPANKNSLSNAEVLDVWVRICKRNELFRKSVRRRRQLFLISISAAAACIIGLLFIPFLSRSQFDQETDIYSFVSQTKKVDLDNLNTQLILSTDKVLALEEKESDIVYDSENIKVNNDKKITKEESSLYNQLIVPKGKRSTLTFSDGTKVWVNAGTRLIYPAEFTRKERELYVDGEIYIHVSPDKSWPFVVKTKDIDVSVLGTEFNVCAYESEEIKSVILALGSIKIKNKNEEKEILLTPNKRYSYDDTHGIVETVDILQYTSWKDGLYIFEKERLSVILNCLSRYYGEPIEFTLEAGNMKCSGKLDLKNNLSDVLKGLTYTVPVMYETVNNKSIITHKANNTP